MKQIVLDTNVLLSFLTDRDAEQQLRADQLFQAAGRGQVRLVLPQIAVNELVYVLLNFYRVEPTAVAEILEDLLASPGLQPVHEVSWSRVLELWPNGIKDYADAVLAQVAREGGYDCIATFDQRFIRGLRREGLAVYWE